MQLLRLCGLQGKCIVTYFSYNLLNICPLHQDGSTDKDRNRFHKTFTGFTEIVALLHFNTFLSAVFKYLQVKHNGSNENCPAVARVNTFSFNSGAFYKTFHMLIMFQAGKRQNL